jgi:hypothetical protein
VCIDAIRTLHVATMNHFDFSVYQEKEILDLLNECRLMLNDVRLTLRTQSEISSARLLRGERDAVYIAARLNQIGVPAVALDT